MWYHKCYVLFSPRLFFCGRNLKAIGTNVTIPPRLPGPWLEHLYAHRWKSLIRDPWADEKEGDTGTWWGDLCFCSCICILKKKCSIFLHLFISLNALDLKAISGIHSVLYALKLIKWFCICKSILQSTQHWIYKASKMGQVRFCLGWIARCQSLRLSARTWVCSRAPLPSLRFCVFLSILILLAGTAQGVSASKACFRFVEKWQLEC